MCVYCLYFGLFNLTQVLPGFQVFIHFCIFKLFAIQSLIFLSGMMMLGKIYYSFNTLKDFCIKCLSVV